MKVLIICEDPTNDRFIAEPVIRKILEDLGKQTARIYVLPRRKPTGVHALTTPERLLSIFEENPMIDLFVLIVDRDGEASGNSDRAAKAASLQSHCVATCAVEEVEAWMLAIFAEDLACAWGEVRSRLKVSDALAEPFLRARGWSTAPGAGRKIAMRELGRRWRAVQDRCPEIKELRSEIAHLLASR